MNNKIKYKDIAKLLDVKAAVERARVTGEEPMELVKHELEGLVLEFFGEWLTIQEAEEAVQVWFKKRR